MNQPNTILSRHRPSWVCGPPDLVPSDPRPDSDLGSMGAAPLAPSGSVPPSSALPPRQRSYLVSDLQGNRSSTPLPGPCSSGGGVDPVSTHPHVGAAHSNLHTNGRWWKNKCSLKLLLVTMLVVFTAMPAAIMWAISWCTAQNALTDMEALSQQSMEDVTWHLRQSLIVSALTSFSNLIRPVQSALNFTQASCATNPFFRRNITIDDTTLDDIVATVPDTFQLIRSNPDISMITVAFNYRAQSWVPNVAVPYIIQWHSYSRHSYNIETNRVVPEYFYMGEQRLTETKNATFVMLKLVNQTTGTPRQGSVPWVLIPANTTSSNPIAINTEAIKDTPDIFWCSDVYANQYTGVANAMAVVTIPFPDLHAFVSVSIYTSLTSMSTILRSMVWHGPDRLFMSFRNKAGHLIGTSHGKYYSHSDIDYSRTNLLTNPIPVGDIRMFTAIDCTDPSISAAGRWLINTYQSWDAIPEFSTTLSLESREFWFHGAVTISEFGMPFQLFVLIDRNSFLGPIIDRHRSTDQSIRTVNSSLSVVLAVVVLAALALSVGMSCLLSRSLARLATGMDGLALIAAIESNTISGFPISSSSSDELKALQRGIITSSAATAALALVTAEYSAFTEVSLCQNSFGNMERKLKLLMKFVSRDVLRLIAIGALRSSVGLSKHPISVMFVEMDSFARLLEGVSSYGDLSRRLTLFVQTVCDIVVDSNGFVDKLIGDTVLALWNTPHEVACHASIACGAAAKILKAIRGIDFELHDRQTALSVRIGLFSGDVLLGTFGCNARMAYTCIGPGVGTAKHLADLNKIFGTEILLNEEVYFGAQANFHFRKIGPVAVRGRPAVMVYEPVALSKESEPLAEGDDSPKGASGSGANSLRMALGFPGADSMLQLRDLYTTGLEDLSTGRLDLAERTFTSAVHEYPRDGPSRLLLDLIRAKRYGVLNQSSSAASPAAGAAPRMVLLDSGVLALN